MSDLEEKAKTLQQWMDEVIYERLGKLLLPQNPKQVEQKLIRLEDAQQQEQALLKLLKEEKDRCENNMIMVLWKERQVWKQKLQQLYKSCIVMKGGATLLVLKKKLEELLKP